MSLLDVLFGDSIKNWPDQSKPIPTPHIIDKRADQTKPVRTARIAASTNNQPKPQREARAVPSASQSKPDPKAALTSALINKVAKTGFAAESFVQNFKNNIITNDKYRIADRKFFMVGFSPESVSIFDSTDLNDLPYLVQEIDIPTLSINDSQKNVDTELGAFRTPDLNARLQANEQNFTIKFLDTEYSMIERFFYGWMKMVMTPTKNAPSASSNSFPRMTVYVDFFNNANSAKILEYRIYGVYPTSISPPTATYGEGRGGVMRAVNFHFNFMDVASDWGGNQTNQTTKPNAGRDRSSSPVNNGSPVPVGGGTINDKSESIPSGAGLGKKNNVGQAAGVPELSGGNGASSANNAAVNWNQTASVGRGNPDASKVNIAPPRPVMGGSQTPIPGPAVSSFEDKTYIPSTTPVFGRVQTELTALKPLITQAAKTVVTNPSKVLSIAKTNIPAVKPMSATGGPNMPKS